MQLPAWHTTTTFRDKCINGRLSSVKSVLQPGDEVIGFKGTGRQGTLHKCYCPTALELASVPYSPMPMRLITSCSLTP